MEARSDSEKLQASYQDLEQFAYIASHDLQEPLRKISVFSDKLRGALGDNLNTTANDYLVRIEEATQRMKTLLNAILEYSRVETNGTVLQKINTDYALKLALADLDDYIIRNEASIIMEGDFTYVMADLVQLQQLFTNLITNAIKYRKENLNPILIIETKTENGSALIRFIDNGIGFEQQYAQKIFQQLQRLHGRNSNYEGTGMGLAICKKIIERHNGSIEAFSRPNEGSLFEIRLPLAI